MTTDYLTAPNPVKIKDHFPILFYSGENVVEITMIEASVLASGNWRFDQVGTILEKAPARINRVVFEGPEGCYQADVLIRKGDNVVVTHGQGAVWYLCDRG